MEKYVLHDGNKIIDMADTKKEIIEKEKMSKIFRRMVGLEPLQMALAHLDDKDYEDYLQGELYIS